MGAVHADTARALRIFVEPRRLAELCRIAHLPGNGQGRRQFAGGSVERQSWTLALFLALYLGRFVSGHLLRLVLVGLRFLLLLGNAHLTFSHDDLLGG